MADSLTSSDEIEERSTWDVAKTRNCLMCKTEFESAWSGERICRRCKSSNTWRSG